MSEQSFEEYLAEFVEKHGPPVFKKRPWYNSLGDTIEYLIVDEAYYAAPVDESFTLYNSVVDKRPVGFQITNARLFIERIFPTVTLSSNKAKRKLMRMLKKGEATAGCSICWMPFDSREEAEIHSKSAHPRMILVARG